MEEFSTRDRSEIEGELSNYVNSLIEPLESNPIESCRHEASTKKRISLTTASSEECKRNQWIVGANALDDLRDIVKLVKRDIEGGSESQRHAIFLLGEWNIVKSKILPLWKLSSDNIDVQSLIIQLLFWLTLPPDENWRKYHEKSAIFNTYLKYQQQVKAALCCEKFWLGIINFYKKLTEFVDLKGYFPYELDLLKEKQDELIRLREVDNSIVTNNFTPETNNICSLNLDTEDEYSSGDRKEVSEDKGRFERLEMIYSLRDDIREINNCAEHRVYLYRNRMKVVKALIIQLLKIRDPNVMDSIRLFGKKSLHLTLVYYLIIEGILDIFEDDCKELIEQLKKQRNLETALVDPWHLLDLIYGIVCRIQPSNYVEILFGRPIGKNNKLDLKLLYKENLSKTFNSIFPLSIMKRHSNFNPELARRRIRENNGDLCTNTTVKSVKVSCPPKYKYFSDIDEKFEYIDILIGPMQSATNNISGNNDHFVDLTEVFDEFNRPSFSFKSLIATLGEYLERFIAKTLPVILGKLFLDVRSSRDNYNQWDIIRLLSLMTWILSYKRGVFLESIKDDNSDAAVTDELARLLKETKCLVNIDLHGSVSFAHEILRKYSREALLKDKSDKVTRVVLRFLNEQFKIIDLTNNSRNSSIKQIGFATVAYIVKLDIMSDLSWILKNFSVSSHHPELLLYSIEVSNRLIKLIGNLGGSAVVQVAKKKREYDKSSGKYDEDYIGNENFTFDKNKIEDDKERIRIMNLDDILEEFCDGRVIANIMMLVKKYRINHSNVNWHISRFARKLITSRLPGDLEKGESGETLQLNCGLFFQLSYFITFSNILADREFSKMNKDEGARDIIRLARHVVHQFWITAKLNPFIYIELFFSKHSPRGMGLADPERLRSLFTNYTKGIDSFIVDRMTNLGTNASEARSHVKSTRNKSKANLAIWTTEEDEELKDLFIKYRDSPQCIAIVSGFLSVTRSERLVKKRLTELGLIESNDKEVNLNNLNSNNHIPKSKLKSFPILGAVMAFKDISQEELIDHEDNNSVEFDPKIILEELCSITEELHSTRDLLEDLDDIPLEMPPSAPISLLNHPAYVAILKIMGFKEPEDNFSLWSIPKQVSQDELLFKLQKIKELIPLNNSDISAMIKDNTNNELNNMLQKSSDNNTLTTINLENVLVNFLEHPDTTGKILKPLIHDFQTDNGLLHLIISELSNLVNSKYSEIDWKNLLIEQRIIWISQEYFESLGIQSNARKVRQSKVLSDLLIILGCKLVNISKDDKSYISLFKGINIPSLNTDSNSMNLFNSDDEENKCYEYEEHWVLDVESISQAELAGRVDTLKKLVPKVMKSFEQIIEESDKYTSKKVKISKSTIAGITKSILDLKINAPDMIKEYIEIIYNFMNKSINQDSTSSMNSNGEYLITLPISENSIDSLEYLLKVLNGVKIYHDLKIAKWSFNLLDQTDMKGFAAISKVLKRLGELDLESLQILASEICCTRKRKMKRKDTKYKTIFKTKKVKTRELLKDKINNTPTNNIISTCSSNEDSPHIEDSVITDEDSQIPFWNDNDKEDWENEWNEIEKRMRSIAQADIDLDFNDLDVSRDIFCRE
ncbi:hypothetical protein cand_004130 [Cryptosporidium andersoni]|uniref:SANT domain-containing protein n=1 Tax=Cryptosporidium andersoni TaxID=117008 RepID=A0A1J4MNW6_9CRYT|nr:hypothetical protein cand_004130 [Cryptosporidium andersoni]